MSATAEAVEKVIEEFIVETPFGVKGILPGFLIRPLAKKIVEEINREVRCLHCRGRG